MTIYIIIAITILLIGSIKLRKMKNNLKGLSLALTGLISVAISVLSFPYYMAKLNNVLLALLSSIRYGPSAITMKVENDIMTVLNLSEPEHSYYAFLLYGLYIAGPICASISIISYSRLLTEQIKGWNKKTRFIFSTLNEKTINIASSVAKQEQKPFLVFCNADKANDESLKIKAREAGALLINRNETQIPIKKNKKYEFFEISDNRIKCLSDTSKLCSSLLSNKAYDQERIIVRCLTDNSMKEYVRKIDQIYGDRIYLRYIDEGNSTARELLRKVMNHIVGHKHQEIIITGKGYTAKAILEHLVYLLHEPESTFTIHVIDPDADKMVKEMKLQCPEVINLDCDKYLDGKKHTGKNYDLRFHKAPLGTYELFEAVEGIADPSLVCVCSDSDKDNYDTAQQIKRFYASRNSDLSYPLIAALITDSEINSLIVNDKDILYFGNYKYRYQYDNIVNPELEEIAKRTHLAYMSGVYGNVLHDSKAAQEKILKDTEYYNYQNIESSMAEGLTLEYRYAYILQQKKDKEMPDSEFVEKWLEDKNNLTVIGNAEHNRWMAYERLQGWRKPTLEQEDVISARSEGKRVRNNEFLLHPALVEVKDLTEAEKNADELLRKYNPESKGTRYVQLDQDIYHMMVDILDK